MPRPAEIDTTTMWMGPKLKAGMNLVTADGVGKSVGTITIKEGKDGVTLEPKLKDLPPGDHGFHLRAELDLDLVQPSSREQIRNSSRREQLAFLVQQ